MFTSLFARGTAKIEVGRFGGTLVDARKWFDEQITASGLDLAAVKVEEKGNVARYNLRGCKGNTGGLLNAVANVEDLHGDAPDIYYLEEGAQVESGKYTKTGSYND